MEWGEHVYDYDRTFSERMDEAKDAALHRDYSRVLATVTGRRKPLTAWWSVELAAQQLGVKPRRVRQLIARGAFPRTRQTGRGRGSPHEVLAYLLPDGKTYGLRVKAGRRGPLAPYSLSESDEEIPL